MQTEQLNKLLKKYGDAFYILDTNQFKTNFAQLKSAFAKIYPQFNIAYSYKTNYTPRLCKAVNELGGFAEVVSDMELEIALRCGVPYEKIIWNGPYKNPEAAVRFMLCGGILNVDSVKELNLLISTAESNPQRQINAGVRCNFDVGDGVTSRFGMDVLSAEFENAVQKLKSVKNIRFASLQCHIATRSLKTWHPRAENMLKILDRVGVVPDYVDLGGGLFGKMADSLKAQFDSYIPTYEEYAAAVAPLFAEKFANAEKKPVLLIEPGSALVGDCMHFVARVNSIKTVRGKAIATLVGSIYNINPTLNKKNPPLTVYPVGDGERREYTNLDFGGFTCIESDYLYRGYNGPLAEGDAVVFGNVGSYSVVLKPPFILPNFPVIDLSDGDEQVKRAENFDDLFHTFSF